MFGLPSSSVGTLLLKMLGALKVIDLLSPATVNWLPDVNGPATSVSSVQSVVVRVRTLSVPPGSRLPPVTVTRTKSLSSSTPTVGDACEFRL